MTTINLDQTVLAFGTPITLREWIAMSAHNEQDNKTEYDGECSTCGSDLADGECLHCEED